MIASTFANIKYIKAKGFTIVEILVVIVVIAILAGVTIFGYGAWRNQLASDAVKSDLKAAATAMEGAKNFGNGYPSNLPSSFSNSDNNTISYKSGDAKTYCIEGRSKVATGVYYFIDSSGGMEPVEGTCAGGKGATPFWTIFVFDTTMPGCNGSTIQLPIELPTSASGSTIDWGDGAKESLASAYPAHTYTTAGEKRVMYSGPLNRVGTEGVATGNRPCLKEVRQWAEDINLTHLSFKFSTNLQFVMTPPDTLSYMASAFYGATSFNQPIGHWNVSKVTNMGAVFQNATSFNQPIGNWDVSNVTSMTSMFNGATSFNQSLASWNTSKVVSMHSMFRNAYAFNQPLNTWNVSNVTSMTEMFATARSFNQPLNSWSTAKVQAMNSMFASASSFNQDLSIWNVTSVSPKPPTGFDGGATAWTLPRPTW